MDAKQQVATDLAGSMNLSLGWRAASPEFDVQRGYTGAVIMSRRGVREVVRLLERMEVVEAIMGGTAPLALVNLSFRYRNELKRLREEVDPHGPLLRADNSALLRADLEQFMALETLVIPPSL